MFRDQPLSIQLIGYAYTTLLPWFVAGIRIFPILQGKNLTTFLQVEFQHVNIRLMKRRGPNERSYYSAR